MFFVDGSVNIEAFVIWRIACKQFYDSLHSNSAIELA